VKLLNYESVLNSKNPKSLLITILVLIELLFLFVSIADASGLSVENRVSPETISVPLPGRSPDQATISLAITNLVSEARPPLDIVLAIDNSASLTRNDPNDFRVAAAEGFIDNLDPNYDRVGIVHWSSTIVGTLPLTSNMNDARRNLYLASSQGNTCIGLALNASATMLKSARPSAKKIIILFSDGYDTCDTDFIFLAAQIRKSGIDIYTIGLGQNNIADLAAIGTYFHSTDPQFISNAFQDIAAVVIGSLNNTRVDYIIPKDIDIDNASLRIDSSLFSSGSNLYSTSYSRPLRIGPADSNQLLSWNIGSMLPRETKYLTFRASSKVSGIYSLGNNSKVRYTLRNGTLGCQSIPPTKIIVTENGSAYIVFLALISLLSTIFGFLFSNRIMRRRG
jgi:hypothetical protein